MTTDEAVLTLAQWLSPAFPIGAFAYSHGLEAAAASGEVRDADGLRDWLEEMLRHGAGRNDALFLAAAWRADNDKAVSEIDATARAFAASKERLHETVAQGEAFCSIVSAVWDAEVSGLSYPVAIGRAAALRGLPLGLTAKMFLVAVVSNLVAAGQRLLPVGQTEAQGIVRTLTRVCSETAEAARDGDLSEISATAFLTDIASMHHETLYSRIFRT